MSVLSRKVSERREDGYLLSSLSAAFAGSSTLPSGASFTYPILSRGTRVLLWHRGPPVSSSGPGCGFGGFWGGGGYRASPGAAGTGGDPGTRPLPARGRAAPRLPSASHACDGDETARHSEKN